MRAKRAPRGGAAVELAALMVMLVPLAMYTLYLEDLLFYKLDQEETVVSSPWDLTNFDYRHVMTDVPAYTSTHLNRTTYADHTSAWNTYGNAHSDGESVNHHQALAAHQCWLAAGGQQVECKFRTDVGQLSDLDSNFSGRIGGVVTCTGTLGVQNYFLPEKFLDRAVAYSKRWEGRDIHGNAPQDGWLFPEGSASMLNDPGALNWIKKTDGTPRPGKHNMDLLDPKNHPDNEQSEWHGWVHDVYQAKGSDAFSSADDFLSDMDDFLTSNANVDRIGDKLSSLPLAYKEDPAGKFDGFMPSGWADQRVENTGGAREGGYMGMPVGTW